VPIGSSAHPGACRARDSTSRQPVRLDGGYDIPLTFHVSKRTTFNHNNPIPQGVHSEVTQAGRAYATAALVVDPMRRA
jgi:hypothetical protein